jgi:hypothetical protein
MSKFEREMAARGARVDMIQKAMREYENAMRTEYGSPYASMAGLLESLLTSLAADRLDSTEDLVRTLKRQASIHKTMETV